MYHFLLILLYVLTRQIAKRRKNFLPGFFALRYTRDGNAKICANALTSSSHYILGGIMFSAVTCPHHIFLRQRLTVKHLFSSLLANVADRLRSSNADAAESTKDPEQLYLKILFNGLLILTFIPLRAINLSSCGFFPSFLFFIKTGGK